MMHQREILIKWTGSKRNQASYIVSQMPKTITTYYEPFVGGGSVLYNVLKSDILVQNFECSDLNADLINIWQLVKSNPQKLIDTYNRLWPFDREKYYNTRDEFNQSRDAAKLFCLLRASRNGLVRYNKKGFFTSAFHNKRKGANPDLVQQIIIKWSKLINEHNVIFQTKDYSKVQSDFGDVVYADPPYETNKHEFYNGEINTKQVWDWAFAQKGLCLLSTDTQSPKQVKKIEIPAGFHRLNRNQKSPRKHNFYIINPS